MRPNPRWDYGYQITGIGERTTIADGARPPLRPACPASNAIARTKRHALGFRQHMIRTKRTGAVV
jgi:hypothetical protein